MHIFLYCRQVVFNYRQSIAGQLKDELDPAMALHLAVVLMVQVLTGHMLHAPGRCVPAIVTFLQPHVSPENHQKLLHYQGKYQHFAVDDHNFTCQTGVGAG